MATPFAPQGREFGLTKAPGAQKGSMKRVHEERSRPEPTLPFRKPLYATYLDHPEVRSPEWSHLVDKTEVLLEAPEWAFYSEDKGRYVVDWIQTKLRHYQGEWAGTPFWLMFWQMRLILELFGWMIACGECVSCTSGHKEMCPGASRLYRVCYLEVPRKNGKSTLASAISLYLAHGDEENAPQIFFAAKDTDQAAICYKSARFMAEASHELVDLTVFYNSRQEMILADNPGGFMRALSSLAMKQYGLNVSGLIFDELMVQDRRDLWNALTTASGSRLNPLVFAISTAGWEHKSICFEQHEHTRQVAEGKVTDLRFLGVVYGAPIDADWTDQQVWLAASPSLDKTFDRGGTVRLEYYEQKCQTAKNIPTEENAFRVLFLSQWVGQAERVFPMDHWDRCSLPPLLTGMAYGGLDLSETLDLTAFVLAFAYADGWVDLLPWFFIPADTMQKKIQYDRVPYDTWAKQGFVISTPGRTIDYKMVEQTILAAHQKYNIQSIAYDRFNSNQLVRSLEDQGLQMDQLGQGFIGMSPPTKELLRLIVDEKIRHGGNPVLRWNMDNAAALTDAAGNIKPAKDRSSDKIDGTVASIMAIDGVVRNPLEGKRSVYEDRGMMSVGSSPKDVAKAEKRERKVLFRTDQFGRPV